MKHKKRNYRPVSGEPCVYDDGEKFYEYVEWLEYLVKNFLDPWSYKLNGEMSWSGEEDDDRGTIYVKENKVEAVDDDISNPGPSWAGD